MLNRLCPLLQVYCYPPKTDVSFPTNADPFNGIEVAHFLTIALEEFDKVKSNRILTQYALHCLQEALASVCSHHSYGVCL